MAWQQLAGAESLLVPRAVAVSTLKEEGPWVGGMRLAEVLSGWAEVARIGPVAAPLAAAQCRSKEGDRPWAVLSYCEALGAGRLAPGRTYWWVGQQQEAGCRVN